MTDIQTDSRLNEFNLNCDKPEHDCS